MREPDRQLREKLVEVLNEFHIAFEDRNMNGAPALAFQLNRVTRNYPYRGGDYRANLNAAAILRRLLLQNGYTPNIAEDNAPRSAPAKMSEPEARSQPASDVDVAAVFAKLDRNGSHAEPPLDYDAAIAKFQTLKAASPDIAATSKPSAAPTPPVTPKVEAVEPPTSPPVQNSPATPAEVNSMPNAPPQAKPTPVTETTTADQVFTSGHNSFLVYQPKPEYVPAEVMIIRLDLDLIANAGDCLIIPIHAPSKTTALSYNETVQRYARKQDVEAARATATIRVQAPAQPVVAPMSAAEPVPVSAAPKPVPAKPVPVETVEEPVEANEGEFALPVASEPTDRIRSPRAELFGKPRFGGDTPAAMPRATDISMISQPIEKQPLIKRLTGAPKIPVPVARMIVAVYRSHTERKMEWVPSGATRDFLDEQDSKQFSARMPLALNKGLAVRTLRQDGPGYQWKLTDAGTELAAALFVPRGPVKPRQAPWAGVRN